MRAERARIVLACAEPGSGVARVAAELGSTRMTVRKWRGRFAEAGLAGLADHDRPGRPVAQLVLSGAERRIAGELGEAGGRPLKGWRCGRGSCWPARTAAPISPSLRGCG